MRKKMLLLTLALAATVASLTVPKAVAANHSCPQCTTYADCSQCCVSCLCDENNHIVACTNHYCPPSDGPCEKG